MAKTRKRRKKTRKIHPIWAVLILIAASVVYSHRTELGALRVTLIIIASGVVLGAIIGYRRGRHRAVVLTAPPRKKAAPAKPQKPAADPALPATKEARRKGWLPPDSPKQGMLTITPECAGDECAVCSDPKNCSCPCDHDAAKIVARNAAHYDQKHDDDIPPY